MQPLLNASKAWQTSPAGSLKKRELSIQHKNNKWRLVTEVDELFSETKKVKQFYRVIPKFKT